MARSVKDAAILLGALCGVDDDDSVTKESSGKSFHDYTQFLDANGLKGKRIGIDKSFLKKHEGFDVLINEALENMKGAGATIVEIEPLMNEKKDDSSSSLLSKIADAEMAVLCFEFKDGLNRYLSKANAKVKSLKEVIEFNKQHEEKAMPYFKQELFEMTEAKGDLKSADYLAAIEKTNSGSRIAIDAAIMKNNLDAICGPVIGPANCIDEINGDYGVYYGAHEAAAMAGYPHITVPAGMVFGLPVGINFFSTAYSEAKLIAIGYAYEAASKQRKIPAFKSIFSI